MSDIVLQVMLRVHFLADVPVDIATVPAEARGALGIRHTQRVPQFSDNSRGNVATNENGEPIQLGTGKLVEVVPTHRHYFRRGWQAELPADMAADLIEAGMAKIVPGVKFIDETDREVG